jgi:hypothetical protein
MPLLPAGRRDCQGVWTAVEACPVYNPGRRHLLATRGAGGSWAPCGPGGNAIAQLTEMFNITIQARAGGAPCNNTEGETRSVDCEQPCSANSCTVPPVLSDLGLNTTASPGDVISACSGKWYHQATCDPVPAYCADGNLGSATITCENGQYSANVNCN